MRDLVRTRWPLWLLGALLGAALQLKWLAGHHWEDALVRLVLGPLAGALVLWLMGEGLARFLTRRGLGLWAWLGGVGDLVRWAGSRLSGLDSRAGRRVWLGLALLAAALVLGQAWRGWWLPRQGAAAIRDYCLQAVQPGAQGLRLYLSTRLDLGGPIQDLGVGREFAFGSVEEFPGDRQRDFALRWVGIITIPRDGVYGFGGHVDDGLRVLIDGRVAVADLREAPPREVWGRIDLAAGPHAIEILYFQKGGQARLGLLWQAPGGVREPLPPAILSPLRPGTHLGPLLRLRLEHNLVPPERPTYDPLVGGRFWKLPW